MIVLDASAAVRTVMDKDSPFQAMLKTADLVIAPELIVAEVCSAFRKYVRARVLSPVEAEKLIERTLSLVDQGAAVTKTGASRPCPRITD